MKNNAATIAKLRAVAADPAATPSEVETATRLADRLENSPEDTEPTKAEVLPLSRWGVRFVDYGNDGFGGWGGPTESCYTGAAVGPNFVNGTGITRR